MQYTIPFKKSPSLKWVKLLIKGSTYDARYMKMKRTPREVIELVLTKIMLLIIMKNANNPMTSEDNR